MSSILSSLFDCPNAKTAVKHTTAKRAENMRVMFYESIKTGSPGCFGGHERQASAQHQPFGQTARVPRDFCAKLVPMQLRTIAFALVLSTVAFANRGITPEDYFAFHFLK